MGLLDLVFGSKPDNPTSGNVGAAENLRLRNAYLDHQTQMQEQGLKPLPYDAWLKQQQAQQPKK